MSVKFGKLKRIKMFVLISKFKNVCIRQSMVERMENLIIGHLPELLAALLELSHASLEPPPQKEQKPQNPNTKKKKNERRRRRRR